MLEEVVGRSYGPVPFEISRSKVEEYVEATTDDPERWSDHAPPSYAGAILFLIAPTFLADPDVAPHAELVIHGEQAFTWHRPFAVGTSVAVTGVLERVRERGGIGFVNFAIEARDADGPLLTAGSTFLMSGSAPPGGDAEEREEPPPTVRGPLARPQRLPAGSGEIPPLAKSASRSDLVRYAGASRDFNPIHWDHDLAVQAGLGGVVAHGLLVAAWATQPAAVLSDRPDPLASARIRFREPLHVDVPVEVRTERKDGNRLDVSVDSDTGHHVTAQIEQAV